MTSYTRVIVESACAVSQWDLYNGLCYAHLVVHTHLFINLASPLSVAGLLPTPPYKFSLWEEFGVPGKNPRLSTECCTQVVL